MKYLSVCSGIEAATVAWQPLCWTAHGFSEIEKFPNAVLQHYYPDTPNFGDMCDFRDWPTADIDVLVGGTPCQSFSVAGLRKGMADPRGNLALVYLAIAEQYRPRWLVWENVSGVLSSNGGRDFGSIVGGMVKLGYGIAYRVLDAQYFGVPQRRRRVFVVASSRDWRDSAKVLFEPACLRRNPPPSRETGKRITYNVAPSVRASGPGFARAGDTRGQDCVIPEIAAPLSAANGANSNTGGRRREDDENLVAFAQNQRDEVRLMDKVGALASKPGMKQQTYVFVERGRDGGSNLEARADGTSNAILTPSGGRGGVGVGAVCHQMAVRRLTPLEYERLQGFPDGYTDIPGASDSGRYKALGNSMAVPVMRWIGERIATAMKTEGCE